MFENSQKNYIRYTQNDKNYVIVKSNDIGYSLTDEKEVLPERIVSPTSEVEAQLFILSNLIDNRSGITYFPKECGNLGEKFVNDINKNNLQCFGKEMMLYKHKPANAKPEHHPLENLPSQTLKLCNKMLKNFSLQTISENAEEKNTFATSLIIS